MRSIRYGIAARLLAAVLALSLVALPQQGVGASSIRYARPGGRATGSCLTWASACTLSRALTVAVAGDQVWAAAGTYTPTTTTDRTVSFRLKNGVAVYGGFLVGQTALRQRRPSVNETILSGEIGAAYPLTSDNSYHVVVAGTSSSPVNSTAVLDGFTIMYGYANADCPDCNGAGILVQGSALRPSSPTLRNLFIHDNTAVSGLSTGGQGAGLYAIYSNAILTNVNFTKNWAAVGSGPSAAGGGMYSALGSPRLTRVTFDTNTGQSGGGMTAQCSSPVLVDVTFLGNHTGVNGVGGGMENEGGGCASIPAPRLTNVMFRSNYSYYGGGMYNDMVNPVLTNATFYSNSTTGTAGGVGSGGGMYNIDSNPSLTNVTFNWNDADMGGDAMENEASSPVIQSSILWGDDALEINNLSFSAPTIAYSILKGGCAGMSGGTCDSANVQNSDPVLGAPASNGGFTQTLMLGAISAAIDAGNPAACAAKDARGVPRPQGLGCDAGAYEVRAMTFASQAANDGYITESAAGTNTGGTVRAATTTFRVGDDALNRQYRAVLSFNTAGLPDTATLVTAHLRARKVGETGATVALGPLWTDVAQPYFGGGPALTAGDYNASSSVDAAGTFYLPLSGGNWYTGYLGYAGLDNINKTGTTQLRARFISVPTDGDFQPDYLTFYSSETLTAANRPRLVVYYNP